MLPVGREVRGQSEELVGGLLSHVGTSDPAQVVSFAANAFTH